MSDGGAERLTAETLGQLVRDIAGGLLAGDALHASFDYRESSTTTPVDGPMFVVDRTYHAEIEERGGQLAAELCASTPVARTLRLVVGSDRGLGWYRFADGTHGKLSGGAGRLAVRRYLEGLEGIPLAEAEVLTGEPQDAGPLRITAWLSVEAFALLLALTGADAPPSVNTTGLLSHRVSVLRHHGNIELRYSWIMLGRDDEMDGESVRARCAITTVLGQPQGYPVVEAPTDAPTLPDVPHVDALWQQLAGAV